MKPSEKTTQEKFEDLRKDWERFKRLVLTLNAESYHCLGIADEPDKAAYASSIKTLTNRLLQMELVNLKIEESSS